MRTATTLSAILWLGLCSASAQSGQDDDVQKGHQLAAMICANCHLAAPDQGSVPILNPPAPSFASIAQRQDINADSLRQFLMTTHRGLDEPQGMPNPELMDYQINDIVTYILSLRK